MMKILIGYDGSECGDALIEDLERAGLPDEAEVTVLSAADVFLPPEGQEDEELFPLYVPHGVELARERARAAFAAAEKLAAEAADKIGERFPTWQVTPEAVADSPHWAIIARTEQWKPNLTIVGSNGRSALGRFILGSVSQKVLYETAGSVRIARGRAPASNGPVKLVLATDGSIDSDAMVETVASRNWKEGASVKLVTAVEHSPSSDEQMSRILDIQFMAKERLIRSGIETTTIVTDEDPKRYLVREATKWDADCIYLGAKGHRFFDRLLIGSVSSSVAARAHCSVEVVRSPGGGAA